MAVPRLPGYTGSHPRDLRRVVADPRNNLRLFVSLDELEELVEYAIADYNGTPHKFGAPSFTLVA
jgi:putative transposase